MTSRYIWKTAFVREAGLPLSCRHASWPADALYQYFRRAHSKTYLQNRSVDLFQRPTDLSRNPDVINRASDMNPQNPRASRISTSNTSSRSNKNSNKNSTSSNNLRQRTSKSSQTIVQRRDWQFFIENKNKNDVEALEPWWINMLTIGRKHLSFSLGVSKDDQVRLVNVLVTIADSHGPMELYRFWKLIPTTIKQDLIFFLIQDLISKGLPTQAFFLMRQIFKNELTGNNSKKIMNDHDPTYLLNVSSCMKLIIPQIKKSGKNLQLLSLIAAMPSASIIQNKRYDFLTSIADSLTAFQCRQYLLELRRLQINYADPIFDVLTTKLDKRDDPRLSLFLFDYIRLLDGKRIFNPAILSKMLLMCLKPKHRNEVHRYQKLLLQSLLVEGNIQKLDRDGLILVIRNLGFYGLQPILHSILDIWISSGQKLTISILTAFINAYPENYQYAVLADIVTILRKSDIKIDSMFATSILRITAQVNPLSKVILDYVYLFGVFPIREFGFNKHVDQDLLDQVTTSTSNNQFFKPTVGVVHTLFRSVLDSFNPDDIAQFELLMQRFIEIGGNEIVNEMATSIWSLKQKARYTENMKFDEVITSPDLARWEKIMWLKCKMASPLAQKMFTKSELNQIDKVFNMVVSTHGVKPEIHQELINLCDAKKIVRLFKDTEKRLRFHVIPQLWRRNRLIAQNSVDQDLDDETDYSVGNKTSGNYRDGNNNSSNNSSKHLNPELDEWAREPVYLNDHNRIGQGNNNSSISEFVYHKLGGLRKIQSNKRWWDISGNIE
ncbi:hypothetical protein V1514DRAFT_170655 [Lipomyces japonicus]|uniref:uncharacterized protein n=1 Tax=Lipomyces japonicus TaxID=56871 RepID=UPI0034CEF9EF